MKRGKKHLTIIAGTTMALFSLFTCFTGAYAWFSTNRSQTVSAGSFEVSALPGIEFDLYYLDYFTDGSGNQISSGDWNDSTYQFSGYEVDFPNAHFTKITYGNDGSITNQCLVPNPSGDGMVLAFRNPTNISQLWPAHRLTFAMALSSGDFSGLSLDKWSEDWGEVGSASETNKPKVNSDTYIRLSWAINIYGWAYRLDGTTDTALASGYQSYRENTGLADAFTYSQASPAIMDENTGDSINPLSIISAANVSGSGSQTVVFFTIEFSNDSATFYRQSTEAPYYYSQDSVNGDSNCYEGLRLTKLEFSLK